jgi:hypothetical protein
MTAINILSTLNFKMKVSRTPAINHTKKEV